jgi:2,3-bisphosphoglycerate-dependent phosphoglycerate mutase
MSYLVLIRHGQSTWNSEGRFQGQQDPSLSARGREDAVKCAATISDISFDCAFCSPLKRTAETVAIIFEQLGISIPIVYADELKECSYGDLEGTTRKEAIEKYGLKQVELFRNGFAVRPPNGESIQDVEERVVPYVRLEVLPKIVSGKNVLLCAHRKSLQPVIKFIENISPAIPQSEVINFCTPMIYTFEGENMVKKEVREVPGIILQSKTAEKVEG